MDKNPLTDPTSLIAYRLAHGETSLDGIRPTRVASSRTRDILVVIVGLAVLCIAVFLVAHI